MQPRQQKIFPALPKCVECGSAEDVTQVVYWIKGTAEAVFRDRLYTSDRNYYECKFCQCQFSKVRND